MSQNAGERLIHQAAKAIVKARRRPRIDTNATTSSKNWMANGTASCDARPKAFAQVIAECKG